MRDELIADQGGAENLSVAKLALIEMISRDVYFLDETDRRIFKVIHKSNELLNKSGIGKLKHIGIMYSYRSAVARNLASNLAMLGLEKVPPKQKTLEEILAEDESETDQPEQANGGE